MATRGRRPSLWLYAGPALAVYGLLFLLPTAGSAWVSFYAWDGVGRPRYRGVRNYVILAGDEVFLDAFANTMVILVAGGVMVFALSFAATMALREMAGRRFARSVLFFPNIVAPVVLSVLWGFLFATGGPVDRTLRGIGISEPPNWLGDNLFAVIFAGLVWMSTGFYVTILMAAVDRIPPYFYEDAILSGATAWQRLRHVTLPLSWDVVATAAVVWTISSLKVFDFIYAFGGTSNDLPPLHVWNTALFVYGQTFGGRTPAYEFGYASASAVITLLSGVVLVVLLRRLLRRDRVEF